MRYSAVQTRADLALAPGVTVATGCLQSPLGGRHPVDPLGELVARHCTDPAPFTALVAAMHTLSGAPPAEVSSGLQAYVLQLHDRKLMSVHQSFLREIAWELILWPFDVMTLMLTRRPPLRRFSSRRIYPATLRGIVRAVIEGHVVVTIASLMVALGAIAGTAIAHPLVPLLMLDRSAILGLLASSVCLLYLGAAFCHELAHLLTARALGLPIVGVQARRGAASVLIGPGRARAARGAVLAGPLAGALLPASVAVAVLDPLQPGWDLLAIDNVRQSVGLVALLLVPAHLLSLTPPFPDGKAIRQLSRDIREADRARA